MIDYQNKESLKLSEKWFTIIRYKFALAGPLQLDRTLDKNSTFQMKSPKTQRNVKFSCKSNTYKLHSMFDYKLSLQKPNYVMSAEMS